MRSKFIILSVSISEQFIGRGKVGKISGDTQLDFINPEENVFPGRGQDWKDYKHRPKTD